MQEVISLQSKSYTI